MSYGLDARYWATVPWSCGRPPWCAQHAGRDYFKMYVLGDSIMGGTGASDALHRVGTILSATYPGDYVDNSIGGRTFNFYASDEARRASVVSSLFSGATPPSDLWIELGYNDHAAAPWSATDFSVAYDDFVNKLRIVLPVASRIYCATPHRAATTPVNSWGSTRNDYAAAIVAACVGKPNVLAVDGTSLGPFVVATDYSDSIHLNDSGQAKMAVGVRAVIGW